MPSSSGIRAGAAFIELSVNDLGLVKGLRAAQRRLESFGKGLRTVGTRMMTAGAGMVGSLLASAKGYASMGDQLDKMSQRTGTSVEALSELGYAAQLSGASLEDVETGMRLMQRAIAGAAAGGAAASDALAKVGLSAQRLMGLAPDQQFALIGERLNGIRDPAQRAAAAMALFGRSGTSLLPMMEGLSEARAEARRLGLVMSGEDAKAAAVFNDSLDRMWASLKMLVATVGSALAPLLTALAGKIVRISGNLRAWLAQNKGFVISALKIGAIVFGIGAAFVALGSTLATLGVAFGVFASVVSGVLGFILSPVGLVIAAIAGIGGAILWATGSGGKALAWLGERFAGLKAFALDTFQGIKDALAAGDIALAARIMWLALQVAWRAGIGKLKGWWLDFKDWFLQTTSNIAAGATVLVAQAWYGLRRIWVTTVNFWADIFNRFVGFFQRTWNNVIAWFEKQWNKVAGVFDSSIDVEAVNRQVDEETQRRNVEISRSITDDRTGGDRELADLERERQGVLDAIIGAEDDKARVRRERYAAEMQESEKELAQAKEAWRAALAKAKAKRTAVETGGPDVGQPDVDALKGQFDAAIPELERALKGDVVGSFSAEAADRMGLGPTAVEERTARASEETAKNTRRIAQKLEQGTGLVFE